jgi:hypothetical protein
MAARPHLAHRPVVVLFLLLMLAWYAGLIEPHGIPPAADRPGSALQPPAIEGIFALTASKRR